MRDGERVTMRFAVVGGGISGLTAAHLLSQRFEVTLFESAPRLGGHTYTVPVDSEGGTHPVDMGFIVYNEKNYPGFVRLMDRLGVSSQPSDMSFSVSSEWDGVEYRASSLNTLFAQRRNLLRPSFHRMCLDILKFKRRSRKLLANPKGYHPSLEDYVRDGGFSSEFLERFLIPIGSSIWSADPAQMRSFPARYLAQFFHNHGFLDLYGAPRWRTLRGGSSTYLAPLSRPFAERVRLSSPVRSIRRHPTHVDVSTDTGTEAFDQVVIAAHSDQALSMLADPTQKEKATLGAIRYQPNETVLHTDERLLPRNPRARASWNYVVPRESSTKVNVTYYSNLLQSIDSPEHYLVSLNRKPQIRERDIIRTMNFDHPVYSFAGLEAQKSHGALNGRNRTSYCGAYWGYGFHEDGVQSALQATRPFGVSL